jgi:uncharacterized protein YeaO (DUF488 family)
MAFRIKRIYEPAGAADGTRVLVDRLWPRGVKKSEAQLAYWMKDVAPSVPLRLWFSHKPERFVEFSRRYRAELNGNRAVGELRKLAKAGVVTLLYAARDPKTNHALVLQSVLREPPREPGVRNPKGR